MVSLRARFVSESAGRFVLRGARSATCGVAWSYSTPPISPTKEDTVYVLIKENGWYVARAGSAGSYTPKLQHARIFTTREEAERNRCGNESIVAVADILRS